MISRMVVIVVLLVPLFGCAQKYMTPGAGVDVSSVSDWSIRSAMTAEPAATFPARIALVRVQGSGYRSYSNASFGRGAFSIVTTFDVERPEDFTIIADLPQVATVVRLNKLVFPSELKSARDLRTGAASLKTDMLLMYTIDTDFWVDKTNIGPLAPMTLGFAPKNRAYVTTTASAALLDTRTGFVYGLVEGTAREDRVANSWNTRAKADKARLVTEGEAFRQMIGQVTELWADLLVEHSSLAQATAN